MNRRILLSRLMSSPLLLAAAASGQLVPATPAGRTFSMDELLAIQAFFRGPGARNRPILEAMEKQIPPPSRKFLKPGSSLTSDLRRKALPLPEALNDDLPTLPQGLRRVAIGPRILLVDANDRILDLIPVTFETAKTSPAKPVRK